MSESVSHTSPTLLGRLGSCPTDEAAWSAFVDRYGPKIYAWCLHWKLQQADAEDVTQAVLLKLAQKMSQFAYDPSRSFRAWLKTLTRHALADFLAGRNSTKMGSGDTQIVELLSSVEAGENLEERLEREFDSELLEEAARRVQLRVAPDKWQVFRLLAIEGLPGAEVARLANMKLATVYVVRSKVQKMLQQEIRTLETNVARTGE